MMLHQFVELVSFGAEEDGSSFLDSIVEARNCSGSSSFQHIFA
jgi:hypothetical protein